MPIPNLAKLLQSASRSLAGSSRQGIQAAISRGQRGLRGGWQASRDAVGALPGQSILQAAPRFAAGLPANKPLIAGTAQTAKNLANIAARPKYPFLDRPVGATAPRLLDKSRSAAGTALRSGSLISTGMTAPLAAYGVYDNYVNGPKEVAKNIERSLYDATGKNPPLSPVHVYGGTLSQPDRYRQQVVQNLQQLRPHFLRSLAGWSDNPGSNAIGGIVRSRLLPLLRWQLGTGAAAHPWLVGAADTLRSTTPLGAAITAALNRFRSLQDPGITTAVQNYLMNPTHLAAMRGTPEANAIRPLIHSNPVGAHTWNWLYDRSRGWLSPLRPQARRVLSPLDENIGHYVNPAVDTALGVE